MGAIGRMTRAQFEEVKKALYLSDNDWVEKIGVEFDGDYVTIPIPDGVDLDGVPTTEIPVESIPAVDEIIADATESALWHCGTYSIGLIALVIVGKMKKKRKCSHLHFGACGVIRLCGAIACTTSSMFA